LHTMGHSIGIGLRAASRRRSALALLAHHTSHHGGNARLRTVRDQG
jgi:hypothetical protein